MEFAAAAYLALARKVIFRLQRIKASGIYGDDYQHKTMWDEYCHEVQEGPHDLLQSAWDDTVDSIIESVIEAIPRHEAVLLTIRAVCDQDREDEMQLGTQVAPDLMRNSLRQAVDEMAGARHMSRFDPTMT
jgi:hypothetical protein